MPDITANLIIKVKDESSGPLDKAGKAGKKAGEDIQKGFAGAIKEATGFDLASVGMAGAIAGVGMALKASIDETVRWGDEVDALSRITGQSAEETSRLAIVMGDIGISTGTLTQASKALRSQGLTPTLDTIKDLAKQYQAIEDPVERNKWGAKTLGRAYNDLSEALSRTPEELDALAAAADNSGRVMDETAIANAEKYAQSLKQLDDKVKGLQVTIGNVLIPTLSAAGGALETEAKIAAALAVKFQVMTGMIDQAEASQRAAAIAAGDLTAAYTTQINDAIDPAITAHLANAEAQAAEQAAAEAASDALSFQNLTLGYGTSAYTEHTKAVQDAKTAAEEAAEAADTSARVYDLVADALSAANIPLNEKIALEKELALMSGATTAELEKEKDAVNFLTTQLGMGNVTQAEFLEITKDLAAGEITAQQAMDLVTKAARDQTGAANDARVAADDLATATTNAAGAANSAVTPIDALEGGMNEYKTAAGNAAGAARDMKTANDALTDKTVTITTNNVTNNIVTNSGGASGRAHGGQVHEGQAYPVGEQGPEIFVPQTSGYVFPAQVNGSGGGGLQRSEIAALVAALQVTISAIPRAVRDGMQRAY